MGKGKESLLLGVCRQGVFAIPILFIMNACLGLYGVVLAQLLSDAMTFVCAAWIYGRVYRKLIYQIDE